MLSAAASSGPRTKCSGKQRIHKTWIKCPESAWRMEFALLLTSYYSGILPLIAEGLSQNNPNGGFTTLFRCLLVISGPSAVKKGMNRCHSDFKNLSPDRQGGLY